MRSMLIQLTKDTFIVMERVDKNKHHHRSQILGMGHGKWLGIRQLLPPGVSRFQKLGSGPPPLQVLVTKHHGVNRQVARQVTRQGVPIH